MKTNKLVIAILAGAAAGFVLSVLIAPEKGVELREKIREWVGNFPNKFADLFSTGQENLLQPAAGESLINPNEILG
jgi:gas vesicle protein